MTTYMNQIVQLTRRMSALDEYGPEHAELLVQRGELILKAIQVGLSAQMISSVIGLNADAMAVQLQYAAAHLVAASAID